ncbi:M1 family metallopeptidase [Salirhabdus sp. Marseille-P4669]|uniref:M1 family metallopeptidase n=1 Tax=Salirhabdus sp. Marseille-P4669 TaxID=2042310 RepID=UPI0013596AC7|nr:M1 family metallopeptidase [Salirhabdus sp. Marseille-P4669]
MDKKLNVTFYTIASLALVVFVFFIFEGVNQYDERTKGDLKEEKPNVEEAASETHLPKLESFEATSVPPGSNGIYEITYELNAEDWFTVHASIDVENLSEDEWDNIAFYLVPNAFTEENKPKKMLLESLKLEINDITVNGEKAEYDLENNNLFVQLEEKLAPQKSVNVDISYKMKIPASSVRLRKNGGGYYLVYSYPMLATYQDNDWNIEHFNPNGESYHTGYGDFTVHYKLPEDYYVVSSGIDGKPVPHSSGTITIKAIKDFYIAFLDPANWEVETEESDSNVTFRSFVRHTDTQLLHPSLGYMKEALHFYEQNIGAFPGKELDLISNEGAMEYPFVIEGYSGRFDQQSIENVIAHEMAHQYFYHSVSNDPFKEAWLDEGLTEFVVTLYLYERYKSETLAMYRPNAFTKNFDSILVNHSIEEYDNNNYGAGVYGMPAYRLWHYFHKEQTIEDALDFLSAYYETYFHKQVTTEEFIRFFEAYHGKHEHEFFNKWIDIDWSTVH